MSVLSHNNTKAPMLGALTVGAMMLATVAAAQNAAPVSTPTSEDMTCQQARDYVARTGRLYVRASPDIIPIYPVRTVQAGPKCETKQAVWYEIHRTTDNPQCLVGFTCSTKY
jgi:hypothetical protein